MWKMEWGKNKYNAQRTDYDGLSFHSKGEADHYAELKLRERAGDIKSFRRQVWLNFYAYNDRGKTILALGDPMKKKNQGFKIYKLWRYCIDFIIDHNDGTQEYVEYKGLAQESWKKSWKILEALLDPNPNITMTVVRHQSYWVKNNFKSKR